MASAPTSEASDERLRAVESQLRQLLDERAIVETLTAYGHAIDYGDEAAFLDCFTPDARWYTVPQTDFIVQAQLEAGRTKVDFRGRDELAGFIAGHTRSPQHHHKHMLVEPRIAFDSDGASVDSYFVRMDASKRHSGAFVRAFGRYRDKLVRCPDGKWRITERRVEVDSFTGEG